LPGHFGTDGTRFVGFVDVHVALEQVDERCDGERLVMYRLVAGRYDEVESSTVLPGVTRDDLMQLLTASESMSRAAWVRYVQRWAQRHPRGEET
jgi:hypothetical protein